MIVQTKYNKGDKVWYMSYQAKKIVEVPVTRIEINVNDKPEKEIVIRYQVIRAGKKSYFYEWQLFETKSIAEEQSFNPFN